MDLKLLVSVVRTVVGARLEALLRFFELRTRLLVCGEMCVEVNVSTEGEILEQSKQKQFGETKTETEVRLKESNMEPMKAPKLDQNIDVHIPSNIGGTSQEFRKARIQQKDKTKSIEENME